MGKFSRKHCAKNPFKKMDAMHNGKPGIQKEDFEQFGSPNKKMVPNCIPKGKLKKKKGDPCWDNYVQRGMKKK